MQRREKNYIPEKRAQVAQTAMNNFIAQTGFKTKTGLKKLKFIYSIVKQYSELQNKDFRDIKILEVGPERGDITFPLASLGCQVRAFDVDADYVKTINDIIEKKSLTNVTVSKDSGYTFCDDTVYDILIITEIYQVLQQPTEFTDNLLKRIKAGSYLIVSVPNGYGPWELKRRFSPFTYIVKSNTIRQWLNKQPYNPNNRYSVNFYTRQRFLELFADYSLELMKFRKSDAFAALLPESLGKRSVLGQLDITLADWLPYWLVNGWYFAFEMNQRDEDGAAGTHAVP